MSPDRHFERLTALVLWAALPVAVGCGDEEPKHVVYQPASRQPSPEDRYAAFEDVPPPVNVNAALAVPVSEGDDAAPLLVEAVSRYAPLTPALADTAGAILERGGWPRDDGEFHRWFTSNARALSLVAAATERGTFVDPELPAVDDVNHRLPLVTMLEELAWLCLLDAARLSTVGETDASWERWNDALRLAVLASAHVRLADRRPAFRIRELVLDTLARRTADLAVGERRLRWLLERLDEAERHTSPLSRSVELEYAVVMRDVDRRAEMRGFGDDFEDARLDARLTWLEPEMANGPLAYARFEPELTRRMARRLFANWLASVDRPRRERAPLIPAFVMGWAAVDAFAVAPGTAVSGRDEAVELLQWALRRSRFGPYVFSPLKPTLAAFTRERADVACARVGLAVEIHRRRHGTYPRTLDDLDAAPLEAIPDDPFARDHRTLRYRREYDMFLVWSVGRDAADDHAEREWTSGPYRGDRIHRFGNVGCDEE